MYRGLYYNDGGDHLRLKADVDVATNHPLKDLADAVLMQAVIDAGKHPTIGNRTTDARKKQKIDIEEARELRENNGWTYVDIGKHFNVSTQAVQQLLSKPKTSYAKPSCCGDNVRNCALHFIDRDYRKGDRHFWLELAGYRYV